MVFLNGTHQAGYFRCLMDAFHHLWALALDAAITYRVSVEDRLVSEVLIREIERLDILGVPVPVGKIQVFPFLPERGGHFKIA